MPARFLTPASAPVNLRPFSRSARDCSVVLTSFSKFLLSNSILTIRSSMLGISHRLPYFVDNTIKYRAHYGINIVPSFHPTAGASSVAVLKYDSNIDATFSVRVVPFDSVSSWFAYYLVVP